MDYPLAMARHIGDRHEWVIGVGDDRAASMAKMPGPDGQWWFGHMTYEQVSGIDVVPNRTMAQDGFEPSHWWRPRIVVWVKNGIATAHADQLDDEARAFLQALVSPPRALPVTTPVQWTRRTSKERYLHQVTGLLDHIQRGDIYEVNYCTARTVEGVALDPAEVFTRLLADHPAPFATFYKVGDRYAIGASPERFLSFADGHVRSQPMKGTRPRHPDPLEDAALARELAADPKERSENVMALDVARHDLGRIATVGGVEVEELCAVHTYPQVHQMISTVRARIAPGLGLADVVRAAFPMASMTGAPKLRAMQLIETMEDQPRGLFSGTVGFIAPDGTADLNVMIRTITYDAGSQRASLLSGGAITAASDPLAEWEECELKARTVLGRLGHVVA